MWYKRNYHYALDSKHGLGILMDYRTDSPKSPCFFEDGTMETVAKDEVDRNRTINELMERYPWLQK